MQFIVFAAFAIALSVPETGPPWGTLTAPGWVAAIVAVQTLLPIVLAYIYCRRVLVQMDAEPAWLHGAQQRLARGNAVIRGVLVGGLCASVYGTAWTVLIRGLPGVERIYGLDEFIALLPFFAGLIGAWVLLYPADRAVRQVAMELRLWAAVPARPAWSLRRYLEFMLRHHVLIVALPMMLIVVANDAVRIYGPAIRRSTHLAWADQALLAVVAGLIFLFAPLLLRFVWHTRPLPAGDLRSRLDQLCRRIGLRYRDILIWESDGMVVNAAVMGMVRPMRYVLLSDGLIEMLDDRQIEAVFGHEAGHVKHKHMHYYLLFAIFSMLLVGGITELGFWLWPGLGERNTLREDYVQIAAMALIVFIWAFGFGAVSRRFEWQADLFGARCVTPEGRLCSLPCVHHGTAELPGPRRDDARGYPPICSEGAQVFADTLHQIALLNGIPPEARSWRHSSIAHRIRMLRGYPHRPAAAARLERSVTGIKILLAVGTVSGLLIGVMLYGPVRLW